MTPALDSHVPLVPSGKLRTAALRFLGLKPEATDERAHAVIRRWMERDDPRFERYYDRFVELFEPITRERIKVSPARYQRIVSWQRDPLYGLVPYEAIYPGGDPEEIDDDDVREPAPLTIEQMAERIARHFDIPHKTAKLAGVLARLWRAERTDQPVSVIAAITGVAPEDPAARRELKNLLRRSAEKGAGRPRGRTRRALSLDQIAVIRADARRVRKVIARYRGKPVPQQDAICDLVRSRSPRTQRAIERLFTRKDHEPRDIVIFVRARLHRLPESTIKRIRAL